jgi:hypothetical protein
MSSPMGLFGMDYGARGVPGTSNLNCGSRCHAHEFDSAEREPKLAARSSRSQLELRDIVGQGI